MPQTDIFVIFQIEKPTCTSQRSTLRPLPHMTSSRPVLPGQPYFRARPRKGSGYILTRWRQGNVLLLSLLLGLLLPQNAWGQIRLELVELPDNTPHDAAFYLVADFNQWNPGDPAYRFRADSNGVLFVELPAEQEAFAFKVTRGNWSSVEGDAHGRQIYNRYYQPTAEQGAATPAIRIPLRVESWEDLEGHRLSVYNVFMLLAALQGLVLVVAILSLQDNNRSANLLLSGLLVLLSVALLSHASVHFRDVFNAYPKVILLADLPLFAYAPLFYLYMHRLLTRRKFRPQQVILHFVPAMLQLAAYLPLLLTPTQLFIDRKVEHEYDMLFSTMSVLAFFYNTIYWAKYWGVLRTYHKNFDNTLSFSQNLTFLRGVLLLKACALAVWLVALLVYPLGTWLSIYPKPFTDLLTDTTWIVLSGLTYLLGYFAMQQPEIFKLSPKEQTFREPEPTPDEELLTLKAQLSGYMEAEAPHRNPRLTLSELAEGLSINLHTLSRVINEGFGKNFHDFVNGYRVTSFQQMVADGRHQQHTLLALGLEAGFNSKTAFNRSFKKITGQTPSEYLKTQETLGSGKQASAPIPPVRQKRETA